MQVRTRSRFRSIWLFLIVLISVATLWSGISGARSPLGAIVGHRWAHFLLYLVLGCIAFLAWRMLTAFIISFGMILLSVVLQLARAGFAHAATDTRAAVVNLLGIIAGALLGLNILTFRSNSQRDQDIERDRPPQPGA